MNPIKLISIFTMFIASVRAQQPVIPVTDNLVTEVIPALPASIVGISNFNTFMKNTESYRRDLRRVEYGDERDPKVAAYFESIAPLNHTDKIKKPLFVIQGGKISTKIHKRVSSTDPLPFFFAHPTQPLQTTEFYLL